MVERLVHDMWQPCEMSDIKEGDVFRTIDAGAVSPLMIALTDAEYRPAFGRTANRWHVKSTWYSMGRDSTGTRH